MGANRVGNTGAREGKGSPERVRGWGFRRGESEGFVCLHGGGGNGKRAADM